MGNIVRRIGTGAWLAGIVAVACVVAGCTEQKQLSITTEPGFGTLQVYSNGKQVGTGAVAPTVIDVSEGKTHRISATPADQKSYLPLDRQLTWEEYQKLPLVGKKTRELKLVFERKEFVELQEVVVVLDSQGRFRGRISQSRAYIDTAEQGGRAPRRVVNLKDITGIQSLALAPDGERIVFSAASFNEAPDLSQTMVFNEDRMVEVKGFNIKGIAINSGGIQHLTSEDFRDMYPFFTPDGKELIFSSNRRRPGHADILLINAQERSGVSNVYVDPRNALALRPTMCADGTIAFAYYPEADKIHRVEVWTLGGANRFPTQIAKGSQPMISPKGEKVAYIGEDGNLWVCSVNGSSQIQLTSSAGTVMKQYEESLSQGERHLFGLRKSAGVQTVSPYSFPCWTPDGQSILYTAMDGTDATGRPNEDIWIMRADGSGKQQLTTNGSADRYPLMSPDMKSIYFMSNRGGHWAIWAIAGPELGGR